MRSFPAIREVKRRVAGKKVVVMLDSLHTEEHVLAELRAYAPLVDVGSYVIVQDTANCPDTPSGLSLRTYPEDRQAPSGTNVVVTCKVDEVP